MIQQIILTEKEKKQLQDMLQEEYRAKRSKRRIRIILQVNDAKETLKDIAIKENINIATVYAIIKEFQQRRIDSVQIDKNEIPRIPLEGNEKGHEYLKSILLNPKYHVIIKSILSRENASYMPEITKDCLIPHASMGTYMNNLEKLGILRRDHYSMRKSFWYIEPNTEGLQEALLEVFGKV